MKPSKMNQKIDELIEEKLELQAQLSAEWEKNDDWRNTERRVARERDEARQQLAAEKESLVAYARDEVWEEVKQLKAQLAAAVEALKEFAKHQDPMLAKIANAALAKVKEGK